MAKRNQYNRTNFRQIGPMDFSQPLKFSRFNTTPGSYLTVPMNFTNSGVFPSLPTFAGIVATNIATWPIPGGFGGAGALDTGASVAAQIWDFNPVTINNDQSFLVTLINSQITPDSIILVETKGGSDNGVYINHVAQDTGTVTWQICSNGSSLVADSILFMYLILGAP